MRLSFVVLDTPSESVQHTMLYAAGLGAALPVHLTLLHAYHAPALLAPEQVPATTDHHFPETTVNVQQLARELLRPAEVQLSDGPLPEALEQALQQFQPLLLVLGLSAEHNLLDQLLRNHLLPVLRATHHPLLLVPEASAAAGRPSRVLLAIDAKPYRLSPAARALTPLLASWQAAYTVVHVLPEQDAEPQPERQVLAGVRAGGLLPPEAPLWLYQEAATSSAEGILQALADTKADLLILLARPRHFLGRLFHQRVTAEVLRRSPVPVLLLPVAAPEQPGWMPAMS
jgi:nucleotide-binding universal stress UspA family protein